MYLGSCFPPGTGKCAGSCSQLRHELTPDPGHARLVCTRLALTPSEQWTCAMRSPAALGCTSLPRWCSTTQLPQPCCSCLLPPRPRPCSSRSLAGCRSWRQLNRQGLWWSAPAACTLALAQVRALAVSRGGCPGSCIDACREDSAVPLMPCLLAAMLGLVIMFDGLYCQRLAHIGSTSSFQTQDDTTAPDL